jgi:YD repeat-containing protein
MRKLYFLLISFILIIIGSNLTLAHAFIGKSKPVQESSVWQGKDVRVDLFSGDASYTVPIQVPPGTNALTPQLNLEYHSGSARGKSIFFGLGWSFNFSYILRDVHYTPDNTTDDTFKLVWDGTSYDLIDMGNDTFRTKNQTFLSIKLNRSSTENSKAAFWVVKTTDGTSYRLGYRGDSELACSNRDYIIGWGVDEVTDTNGNHIYYSYSKNVSPSDIGAIYPLKIEYNNDKTRSIEFTTDTNDSPNLSESYFQGCRFRFARQIKTVTTKVNGVQVKKYTLNYIPSVSRLLINSVVESGSNDTQKPPTKFDYFPQVSELDSSSQTWANNIGTGFTIAVPYYTPNAPVLITPLPYMVYPTPYIVYPPPYWYQPPPQYTFFPYFSVYYPFGYMVYPPGYLYYPPAYLYQPPSYYQPAIGGFWMSATTSPAQLADVNGDGLVDIVDAKSDGGAWNVWLNLGDKWSATPQVWANNIGASFSITIGGSTSVGSAQAQLVDVNGDGLPDIVSANNGNGDWKVWLNLGDKWSPTAQIWANNLGISFYAQRGGFGIFADGTPVSFAVPQLADVNGDGLADIVSANSDSGAWNVWLNLGNKWSSTAQVWANNIGTSFYSNSTPNAQLTDVNGDGLVDIVSAKQSNSDWNVWLNQGDKWSQTAQVWAKNIGENFKDVKIADVNGDGLPDIVSGNQVKVRLNLGNKWSDTPQNWVSNLGFNFDYQMPVVDVNGDGLADILYGGNTSGAWKVWLNKGKTPDLLAKITNTTGGTTQLTYSSSTGFNNKGNDAFSDLPFSLWVPTAISENNGISGSQGTSETTTLSYINGKYDFKAKELRGFGQATVTDANRIFTTKFYQDDGLKGKLYQEETKDVSGNLFSKTENTWKSITTNGMFLSTLDQITESEYDGAANNPRVKQKKFEYDEYGNITKAIEDGDISITGDEKTTFFEYAYNPSNWIVNKLKHTYVQGSNGNKEQEKWISYDEKPSGELTKGNITKEESLVAEGKKVESTAEYDNYGNKKVSVDANNNATKYEYDVTFTYPEKIINPKNQTTQYKYDLATGNLLQVTDPNGFNTKYTFDTFGRKEKEIKEYDSESNPTVQYTYINDGSAPELIKTSYRKMSGNSQTIDEFMYTDGFNRTIQTKKDAENASQQRVENTYYDLAGNISKHGIAYFATKSDDYITPASNEKVIKISYDPLGREKVITNADSSTKQYVYDHGNTTVIDENGHKKTEYKNVYGLITKVEENNGGEIYTTSYDYTVNGLLSLIKDAKGNEISFSYDFLGRKTKMVDPDLGKWTYDYDNVGNLISVTDNRNVTTKREYDSLNRITKVDYPKDTDIIYTYDTDTIGTLSKIEDAVGTTEKTYDHKLRLIKEKKTIDTKSWINEFTYDALDRVIKQKYPNEDTTDFAYNNAGKTTKIQGIVDEINYNPQNNLQHITYSNGLNSNFSYNTDSLRLSKIETPGLQNLEYTYDAVGNITAIKDNILSKTQTFTYDDLDRLKQAKEPDGYDYSYTYNPIGNLISVNNGSRTIDYIYDLLKPHAASSASFPDVTPMPVETFSLTGNVYIDANENGVKDQTEVGYQNAKISTVGADHETVTNESGDFSFANLPFGAYGVALSDIPGYKTTTANPVFVFLPPDANVNIGIVPIPTTIPTVKPSPTVEPTAIPTPTNELTPIPTDTPTPTPISVTDTPIPTIVPTPTHSEPTPEPTEPVTPTVTLALTNTPTPTPFQPESTNSPTPTEPEPTEIPLPTLTPTPVPTYTISGSVYIDSNRNGVQDAEESGYKGATISLDFGVDVVSNSSGEYKFENLNVGGYSVTLTVPEGYEITTQNTVSTQLAPSSTVNFGIAVIAIPTVEPTSTPTEVPAASPVSLYTLSGNLYLDINQNGVKDLGENGFSGAQLSVGTQTIYTDSNGNYQISELSADSYTITVSIPSGYELTTTNPVSLTLSADSTINFGLAPIPTPTEPVQTYSISGTVFIDTNENGVKDEGEGGYPNAKVSALGTSQDAFTNELGDFSFTNLPVGAYSLYLNTPDGYETTTINPLYMFLPPDTNVNIGIKPNSASTPVVSPSTTPNASSETETPIVI